jgi:hypothetical protein
MKTIATLLFLFVVAYCVAQPKIYQSHSPNRLGEKSKIVGYNKVDSISAHLFSVGFKLLGEDWLWYMDEVNYYYSNTKDTIIVTMVRDKKTNVLVIKTYN